MTTMRRLLLAVPVLALGVTGCGAGTLQASTIEDGAADALEKQVGIRPEVTCPDDVAAEEGASTRCTLTAPGDSTEYGVTVTVTSVDGDDAQFDVQVDGKPQG